MYDKVQTKYGIARFVVGCLNFLGWGLLIAGVLILIVGLYYSSTMEYSDEAGMSALIVILLLAGCAIFGLLYIASAQFLRASLDSADHIREMWSLMLVNQQKSLPYGDRPSTF